MPSHLRQHGDRFEDGETILPTSPEIIDLAAAGPAEEVQKQARHIAGMDLVPHLLALIAEDRIGPAGDRTHDNIGEVAMQLNRRVLRTREASTPKDANRHLEVAPELLAQHISRYLGGPEERMEALVNGDRFADAVQAIGIVVPGVQLQQGE